MTLMDGAVEAGLSSTDAFHLASTVIEISKASDISDLARCTCESVRSLLTSDGVTFVLKDGEQVHYAEEEAKSPLWKGRRFPASACISGWSIIHGRAAAIEDIYSDQRIPAEAYRPTFVKSLAMVPIGSERPAAALGVYWSERHQATKRELFMIKAVADAVSISLERAQRATNGSSQTVLSQAPILAVIAHDLKGPLSAILHTVQALALKPGGCADHSEDLARIASGVGRANNLVEQLNAYSRLNGAGLSLTLDAVSLDRICEAVIDEIRVTYPHCRIEYSACPAPGLWDADRLSEAVSNLVRNAAQHGDLSRPIRINVGTADNEAFLDVQNHGEPIAPDLLPRLFEPFTRAVDTSEDASLGLGLHIVKQIVTAHGGRIDVRSSTERGTTFTVRLPTGPTTLKFAPRN